MENIKSKIIPEDLKDNIDEIMEQQLFNANRYYAESNPEISSLMQKEMYNNPEIFLKRLRTRWNWHNLYYEKLLEPAFEKLVRDDSIELSPKEIDDLIKVYLTSCLVDEATLVMSGAIKKYLDYNCQKVNLSDDYLSRRESSTMLITPPIETFFAQYQIDHLYYIYLLKNEDCDLKKFKDYLMNKYHANDEKIFNSRFEKKFGHYLQMEKEKILEEIKCYKISDEYKNRHFYFTLEHSDRKAIRDIIIYDNLDEKLIASNLIGISGFLLRRKILEYLNNSNILKNNGYIYEFNNEIIITALEKLKNERKKEMDKNVRPYKQRGDTCAIACMMMVLEYYKIMDKANWYDEKRLYRIYRSKYMIGTPFSALAYHMSKNGLDITMYHENENMFNNDCMVLENEDFEFAMNEYKENLNFAKEKGTKVINGIEINTNLLKEKLKDGNLVILAGEITGGYHAILLTGYNEEGFFVCDPLFKDKQIRTFDSINKYMNTSIGKWFITINDKTNEKEKLIENLDKFSEEAKNLMKKQESRGHRYVRK